MFAQRAQREHREKMPGLKQKIWLAQRAQSTQREHREKYLDWKTKDLVRTEGTERTQRKIAWIKKNKRSSSHREHGGRRENAENNARIEKHKS